MYHNVQTPTTTTSTTRLWYVYVQWADRSTDWVPLKDSYPVQVAEITDPDFATQITNDADMVFCCVGFVQDEERFWAEQWPTVVHNLLSVTSIDRPLIIHDNLYENSGPKTPIKVSRRQLLLKTRSKAAIRSLLHGRIQERMEERPGSVVAVGGCNIFGTYLIDDKIMHGVEWDVEW